MPLRVLLFADSHLGFDHPARPRVRRRRRGEDFLANHERALAPALAGEVDLVVHGGDVFHRSRVDPGLAWRAYRPLVAVAERGVTVVLVPGNHERSRLPHLRFADHPGVHVFDRPRTVRLEAAGLRVDLVGFPHQRRDVRGGFGDRIAESGWRPGEADVSLLCLHHAVEGATVGPSDFTFRGGPDVIRGRDLPGGFAAVLSGHVHRHQVLTDDLAGRPLAAPVFYPGSVERTAFAEMGEPKGFLTLEVEGEGPGGRVGAWRFHELPARPMRVHELDVEGAGEATVRSRVAAAIAAAADDAVLRLRVRGRPRPEAATVLRAAGLRAMAPETMNVEAVFPDERRPGGRARFRPERGPARGRPLAAPPRASRSP